VQQCHRLNIGLSCRSFPLAFNLGALRLSVMMATTTVDELSDPEIKFNDFFSRITCIVHIRFDIIPERTKKVMHYETKNSFQMRDVSAEE
jgi:hypothetical protein